MVARFATYRDRLVKAVDRIHAEALRFEPRKTGNYGSAADPARATVDVSGPLRIGGSDDDLGGARRNFQVILAEGKAELHLDRALLPVGFAPRKGDAIVPIDRPELGNFEIERVDSGHVARLVLVLSATGRS